MTSRRAIKRTNELMAECPEDGICQYKQTTQGKIVNLSCGYFAGTYEDGQGLHVRCKHPACDD